MPTPLPPPDRPSTPWPHPAPPAGTGPTDRPCWPSTTLLAGGTEAQIIHGAQVYRLRLTASGKLILTK